MRKKEEEEEKKTKFLFFFDFECMQETGVHVPNLVVVQDEKVTNGCLRGPTRARIFANGCLKHGSCCVYRPQLQRV